MQILFEFPTYVPADTSIASSSSSCFYFPELLSETKKPMRFTTAVTDRSRRRRSINRAGAGRRGRRRRRNFQGKTLLQPWWLKKWVEGGETKCVLVAIIETALQKVVFFFLSDFFEAFCVEIEMEYFARCVCFLYYLMN